VNFRNPCIIPATACLVCDGPEAALLRERIAGESFWSTAAAVAAPFGVLLLVLLTLHFLPLRR